MLKSFLKYRFILAIYIVFHICITVTTAQCIDYFIINENNTELDRVGGPYIYENLVVFIGNIRAEAGVFDLNTQSYRSYDKPSIIETWEVGIYNDKIYFRADNDFDRDNEQIFVIQGDSIKQISNHNNDGTVTRFSSNGKQIVWTEFIFEDRKDSLNSDIIGKKIHLYDFESQESTLISFVESGGGGMSARIGSEYVSWYDYAKELVYYRKIYDNEENTIDSFTVQFPQNAFSIGNRLFVTAKRHIREYNIETHQIINQLTDSNSNIYDRNIDHDRYDATDDYIVWTENLFTDENSKYQIHAYDIINNKKIEIEQDESVHNFDYSVHGNFITWRSTEELFYSNSVGKYQKIMVHNINTSKTTEIWAELIQSPSSRLGRPIVNNGKVVFDRYIPNLSKPVLEQESEIIVADLNCILSKADDYEVSDAGLHCEITPNPVLDNFKIDISSTNRDLISSIQLYSIEGQNISSNLSQKEDLSYDISFLDSGVYIVQIRLSNGSFTTKKLIKM